jgi:hypothetical protein
MLARPIAVTVPTKTDRRSISIVITQKVEKGGVSSPGCRLFPER